MDSYLDIIFGSYFLNLILLCCIMISDNEDNSLKMEEVFQHWHSIVRDKARLMCVYKGTMPWSKKEVGCHQNQPILHQRELH